MENQEIKKECEKMYALIKSAEKRLEGLRSECTHEETEECNYSWRVGVIKPAIVCAFCGELILYK